MCLPFIEIIIIVQTYSFVRSHQPSAMCAITKKICDRIATFPSFFSSFFFTSSSLAIVSSIFHLRSIKRCHIDARRVQVECQIRKNQAGAPPTNRCRQSRALHISSSNIFRIEVKSMNKLEVPRANQKVSLAAADKIRIAANLTDTHTRIK